MTEDRNAEAKRLIARLVELKIEIEKIKGRPMTEKEFAEKYIHIKETTWSQLKSYTYYNGNLTTMEQPMRDAVVDIESRMDEIRDAEAYSVSFIKTTFSKAVEGAAKHSLDDPENRKIVVALAPSGFGKTAVANYLKGKGAAYVEGVQSWQSSYRAFCSDVAKALKKNVAKTARQDVCESEMIAAATNSHYNYLLIDEANTLSGPCANGIKEIVNRSHLSVILLAIPEFWDKFLRGNIGEVKQIVNRCQRVVRHDTIPLEDVRAFLRSRKLPENLAEKIKDEANVFGGYRTVISLMNEISSDPTIDELDMAIKRHKTNYALFHLDSVDRNPTNNYPSKNPGGKQPWRG